MEAFVIANMAPLMFASLVVVLLLGYPVAFALAFNGLLWGVIGISLGLFQPPRRREPEHRHWAPEASMICVRVSFAGPVRLPTMRDMGTITGP